MGGGASGAGLFSILDTGLKYPQVVATADGVFHIAYSASLAPSVIVYGRCTQNCGSASSWSRVIIESGTPWTDYTRMVIGTDGRIHLMFELYSSAGGTEPIYATCAANCLTASSWAKANLTSLFGAKTAVWRGSPMVIDSNNRISVVVSDGNTFLGTCASNCTLPASWTVGQIRATGNRTAMVANGTTLHAVMHDNGSALVYRTCASNCTQASSWLESVPLFVHDGYPATAISVSPQGRVTVAYNQGIAPTNETPAVKAQDKQVLVWECSANCMTAAGWAGDIVGAVDDGQDGVALVEAGGTRALVLSQTSVVVARVCNSNCTKAASWPGVELDTSAALSAEFDPYSVTGCSGTPAFAGWYPKGAVAAIAPNGSAVFAYYTTMLRRCSNSTMINSLPGYGRFGYLPP